ncbi:MAG: iron ABC transporter permease [Bacteroidales bacterium]|nr:iron ABC transporter permease [Bacteroidales bacterium]
MPRTVWGRDPIWPILVLAACCGLDLLTGNGLSVPAGVILWKLRLPRMLTALAAGAALGLSGAQMQAVFRNPLADPHIMGVSGGAGLGAAIAALTVTSASLAGGLTMVAAAFAGALLAGMLIVAVSARVQSTGTLLLAGVMLGFILSAVSSVLQYTAGEESLKLFYSWMAGSFSSVRYSGLAMMGAALLAGCGLAFSQAKSLDLVLFGDAFATFSGASLKRLRFVTMLGCALMTGAVTAFCGPIGFAGIAAPHLARKALGTSTHRTVLPGSMVMGAILALMGDILAHLGPLPLPVGSTLAIVGIPLIVWLLWRNRL